MLSSEPEMIWRGRVHLGDEPGIYGDASYSGLAVELPVTLVKTDPAGPDTTVLSVRTEDVQTFAGYPGHELTVTLFVPDPAQPFHANEVVLTSARLGTADNNRKDLTVNLAGHTAPFFVSFKVEIDTDVPPGLYDDFVVTRLVNISQNFTFVASLGFHA
ncbi:hypothetical protein [Actinoplanes sp. L3-i22]|uniref:hypothetical protein n=1 Tax=Actinoplanes sp. L3-i22 TaxID=2836373 RepID=UPI001C77E1CE|nr:hypothetical protein [Actinoplanes sp. L3-i22]BCY09357.1 hypothetical protein L3i22_044450 [Actinoplanes sp. L3-i22]